MRRGEFFANTISHVRLANRPSYLTRTLGPSNLVTMRLARLIFLAILTVALAAYALDCGAVTTPEQAMHCCNSMPCSSHGHRGQDCCKAMPTVRAPFVQDSSVHGVSFSPLVFAVLPATDKSHAVDSSNCVIAAYCHAPPIGYASTPLPLRI